MSFFDKNREQKGEPGSPENNPSGDFRTTLPALQNRGQNDTLHRWTGFAATKNRLCRTPEDDVRVLKSGADLRENNRGAVQ